MRKFLMRLSIVVGAVLTLGGCADSLTQPDQQGAPDLAAPSLDEQAQGCVSDGYCVLPPISGGGGECDPTITECDDGGWDSCATSAPGTPDPEISSTQSCPGGGGGGAGGDGGSGSTTPDAGAKSGQSDTDWNCPRCGERQPTTAEKQVMEAQLEDVMCPDGKQALQSALAAGTMLVYTLDDGRWGSYDSETGLTYISRPKHWLATGVDQRELADTMVHEIVHKLLGHENGTAHTDAHGQEFKNKMAVCGFPQP